ncbi:MAG: polymerase sigma factor, sigma-70 family [Chthonomonadaceae bacterium]|nr:polymerase sigma factor, sigma-70 family [Chthonomonadaceae bacterium]
MTTTEINGSVQEQFEHLFQRSRERAFRHAYRLAGNVADAKDITQDAYVKARSHFTDYGPTACFETWLFRIITNRFIDLRRRQTHHRAYSLDAVAQGGDSLLLECELTAPHSDPAQIVLEWLQEERLLNTLSTLPAPYLHPFLLHAVERRSYKEVAERMHRLLGTVRSRIYRGKQLARRCLRSERCSRV